MDILISADRQILDFVRSVPKKLREMMEKEEFEQWMEQRNKTEDHDGCV